MFPATNCTPADLGRLDATTRARGLRAALPAALVSAAVAGLWLIAADGTGASIGYVLMKSGTSWGTTMAYAAGHVVGLSLLLVLWRVGGLRRRLRAGLERVLAELELPGGVAAFVALVSGIRLLWVLLVPTQPVSDNAMYHELAGRLATGGTYGFEHARAFWPPGYPFFLAGLYATCGVHVLAAKLANVALAAAGDMLVWLIVRAYSDRRCAALALLLTAAWTWRTLHVDVLSYDDLVVVLALASIALIPRRPRAANAAPPAAGSAARYWLAWAAAGSVLGLGCFARSTLGVLPLAVGGWLIVRGWRLRPALSCTLVYAAAMLLPLIPWAARNYTVFHRFVPLTTNAGNNFYTSWAPGSTGALHKPAYLALRAAAGDDELTVNALGFSWGWRAIVADPGQALRVALGKQVHYLGSDNWWQPVESYIAAFGGRTLAGTALKLAGHTLANGLFVFLLLLPLLAVRHARRVFRERPLAWLCLAVFGTGLLIHTVFEAQARYHLIYLPFWSMMLAVLLDARLGRPGANTGGA